MTAASVKVIAPAKINLYLHVTGQRADGYHLLDSLVVFADVFDVITINPASRFAFAIEGAYASAFCAADRESGPEGKNLVVQAAYACSRFFGKPLECRITLAKNMPLAAGIGGGSADAAAVVWGLIRYWDIKTPPLGTIMPLLLSLGADVPVCYLSHVAHVAGIGEVVSPREDFPEWPAVLINPRQAVATPEIFTALHEQDFSYSKPSALPDDLSDPDEILLFLQQQRNDLQPVTSARLPVITQMIDQLAEMPGVQMARMSGSGATIFGLCRQQERAEEIAEEIQQRNPQWWVRSCLLNGVVRY
ncbi:MAG: 4-(cytidine 5'-diphospho)-2-C-methyl-D-erythritol kinase [Micavibrio sp.]